MRYYTFEGIVYHLVSSVPCAEDILDRNKGILKKALQQKDQEVEGVFICKEEEILGTTRGCSECKDWSLPRCSSCEDYVRTTYAIRVCYGIWCTRCGESVCDWLEHIKKESQDHSEKICKGCGKIIPGNVYYLSKGDDCFHVHHQ